MFFLDRQNAKNELREKDLKKDENVCYGYNDGKEKKEFSHFFDACII